MFTRLQTRGYRCLKSIDQDLGDFRALVGPNASGKTTFLDKPEQILCFAKDANGATDIVSGNLHPALREWHQGEPDLGVLFAAGMLS